MLEKVISSGLFQIKEWNKRGNAVDLKILKYCEQSEFLMTSDEQLISQPLCLIAVFSKL